MGAMAISENARDAVKGLYETEMVYRRGFWAFAHGLPLTSSSWYSIVHSRGTISVDSRDRDDLLGYLNLRQPRGPALEFFSEVMYVLPLSLV
jgi:hypothetical protein